VPEIIDHDLRDSFAAHTRFERREIWCNAVWHVAESFVSESNLINYTSYAVALSNTALPVAVWYFLFHLLFVFSLAERKNEQQKED